jgi:hypothetical protein
MDTIQSKKSNFFGLVEVLEIKLCFRKFLIGTTTPASKLGSFDFSSPAGQFFEEINFF